MKGTEGSFVTENASNRGIREVLIYRRTRFVLSLKVTFNNRFSGDALIQPVTLGGACEM
jgi:hypothetical protein